MTERQQTIVCAFDQRSPRVSAFDIHEWVYETLHLQEHEVVMIQIDGPLHHVSIKFKDPQRMQAILTATQGQEYFRHENSEISKVRIEVLVLGMRRVRVASLPPEVEDKTLKMALGALGEISDIQPEIWPNAYRFPVSNGVRVVSMSLVKHIPSHVMVTGYRTLISYEGSRQLVTAATNRVMCKLRARTDAGSERKAYQQPRRQGRKWRRRGPFQIPRQ